MDTSPNEQAFSASNTNTQALPIKRPNASQKYDNATSFSALSSVFSDQKPSTSLVSNWAPSSFGSLTSIDQFFLNSKKTSSSSLNWLGMAGGNNNVDSPDPVIQDANLKEKVKKGYIDLEIYGRQLYNDSSLGLYHMSEHIRKRVPQIVEDKKVLTSLTKDVEVTLEDMKDSCEVIESMPTIPCFNNINEMLKRTLEMVEAKNKDTV